MTGDQRFYLGWAQVWRRNYREANLRQRLLTDPHSPSEQRVAVVRNLDPWYRGLQRPAGPDALPRAGRRASASGRECLHQELPPLESDVRWTAAVRWLRAGAGRGRGC